MSLPEPSRIPDSTGTDFSGLGQLGQTRDYRSGEIIFSVGDPGDGFHVVESGRVEITGSISGSPPRLLAVIGPGDFFGEMAVLDELPRSATARAALATVTRFLNRAELLHWLEQKPHVSLSLMREFGRRMRALNSRYLDEILQAERLAVVGRFAQTIVHDFKNPLNIIGLSAEIGCDTNSPIAVRQESRGHIEQQVTRMNDMLNELIEFTRPSGRRPALSATNFARYMKRLANDLRPEVSAKKIVLELTNAPPDLTVLIDAQRLSRLFYNLINNAMDELHEGGAIKLRFGVTPTDLLIEVADTGKGIPAEMAEHLFQPFATHGKAHGTGLGLSICRKIVDDHGGAIWTRTEPGLGAIFCFTLPLPKAGPENTAGR